MSRLAFIVLVTTLFFAWNTASAARVTFLSTVPLIDVSCPDAPCERTFPGSGSFADINATLLVELDLADPYIQGTRAVDENDISIFSWIAPLPVIPGGTLDFSGTYVFDPYSGFAQLSITNYDYESILSRDFAGGIGSGRSDAVFVSDGEWSYYTGTFGYPYVNIRFTANTDGLPLPASTSIAPPVPIPSAWILFISTLIALGYFKTQAST